eukprot:695777-Pelagomonas_calceolata.AAC.1
MVPIGVHPIHCWVETSKRNLINAVHLAASWAACRGGSHLESEGIFLKSADFFVGELRGCVMGFQTDSGVWGSGPYGDGRPPLLGGTCVSRHGCHGEGIEVPSSNCLMSDGDDHAVVWQNLEVAGVASEHLCLSDMKVPNGNELHGPTYAGATAEASPVRQEHEGGNWFGGLEGGVHCSELEHKFIIVRRVAKGVAAVAHREGISACPKGFATVTCAKLSVVGTVKFKRVGEPFRGDQAPFMQGGWMVACLPAFLAALYASRKVQADPQVNTSGICTGHLYYSLIRWVPLLGFVHESHKDLERFWGLPSKPCFTTWRLSRSVSLAGGAAFLVHRLKHGLLDLGASEASQQPPIEDDIANEKENKTKQKKSLRWS